MADLKKRLAGLDEDLLRRNAALDEIVVHDVNRDPSLPLPDAMFETERADDDAHVHRLALVRRSGDAGGLPDDVLDEGVLTIKKGGNRRMNTGVCCRRNRMTSR